MARARSLSLGQRPVGVHIGAEDVRQDEGVAGVGLLPCDRVAVAVACGGHRVDGVDLALAGAQDRDEQTAGGLDGDRDRGVLGVAVLGKQIQKDLVAGRVVGDVALGQERAVVVDQGDVVRPLGPVNAAVDQLPSSMCGCLRWSRAHAGPRSDLIPGLDRNGPTPHKPFVAPAHRTGPGLFPELRRLGECKRSPCDGLAPPTPTSDQANGVDAAGGREGAERRRSWRRHHGRAERRRASGAHTTTSSVSAGWRPREHRMTPLSGKASWP